MRGGYYYLISMLRAASIWLFRCVAQRGNVSIMEVSSHQWMKLNSGGGFTDSRRLDACGGVQ